MMMMMRRRKTGDEKDRDGVQVIKKQDQSSTMAKLVIMVLNISSRTELYDDDVDVVVERPEHVV